MQDLPSISDSLKEIFPDDVKDNMDSSKYKIEYYILYILSSKHKQDISCLNLNYVYAKMLGI